MLRIKLCRSFAFLAALVICTGATLAQSRTSANDNVGIDLPHGKAASDFDGDGATDLALWNPMSGSWMVQLSSTGNTIAPSFGQQGDIAVPGDYDGDNVTDFAVYRPSEGSWYINNSSNFNSADFSGFDKSLVIKHTGIGKDIPVPADYDGDGITDVAVFRQGESVWYIYQSSNGLVARQQWGVAGDQPVPGDFDGNGAANIAIYRPSTGNWYIYKNEDGVMMQTWGTGTDVPVPADYDGDGKTDFAVFRPEEGNWYVLNSQGGATVQGWGNASDMVVPTDYDGDGRADIAVWRGSEGNWYILSSAKQAVILKTLGYSDDQPVVSLFSNHFSGNLSGQ